MKVLFVSSEVAPFAKTGGLADVAGSLPGELKSLGVDVSVIMPLYGTIDRNKYNIRSTKKKISAPISNFRVTAEICKTESVNNVTTYFIKNDNYYKRDQLYGTPKGDYHDNCERFTFFNRAVIEFLKAFNFKADVIHINDWQAGLIPVYLKTVYNHDKILKNTATLMTVHNLAYQGQFWCYDMPILNLSWALFNYKYLEFYNKINFLKGGLIFSDIITTVSKKYSKEIQTEEYGCGLEGVLKERSKDLYGVLNGVDYNIWSPEADKLIAANYDSKAIKDKESCKKDLRRLYNLPQKKDVPIIGIISRFADQKGFDLIAEVIDKIMALDLQLVVLGTGEQKYHDLFKAIGRKYKKSAGIKITYDNTVAHKIEAGSDFFLMPSRYEPCGLNQIYSLKYGTIPIVRATGGLDDTINNYNFNTRKGSGIKFNKYDSRELLKAIKKAIKLYNKKDEFEKLKKEVMTLDFSWKSSAEKYISLYKKALNKVK
jgi:starch synthase